MSIDLDDLIPACGDGSADAGITIEAELEPLAGPGAPVKPATYAGARQGDPPRYQEDVRWWGDGEQRKKTKAIVVDNVPSQANRCEAALEVLRIELGVPEIVLDLGNIGALPSHLPEQISGFRFPHRNADAYLRDALLDGDRFVDTSIGQAIFSATADQSLSLLEWFPQSLLYGFWQSHLGKKRSQAKLARSWTSEIVGYDPATTDVEMQPKTLGLKGDPINQTVDETVVFDEDDLLSSDWSLAAATKGAEKGKKKDKLSNIGHGQVPVGEGDAAPAGVSFSTITQRSTVSFAALRRVHTGLSPDADAAGRALLVSLGLVAHVAAFGRSFSLRSGCELRPRQVRWTWLGETADSDVPPLNQVEAIDLFRESVKQAEAAGLPVGSRWASEPLVLAPNESLAKAIRATWPLEG